MPKSLFIVVNVDWFFLSHRLPIALSALKEGYQVTIVSTDTGKSKEIQSFGLQFIDLPMSRSSQKVVKEIKVIGFLFSLYRKYKPDIIHHVGLKTILYGTIASKLTRMKGVVNAISGLGIYFSTDNSSSFSNRVIGILRFSHKQKNLFVIFQNEEDKALFLNNGIIKETQAYKIKGSGVDLNDFYYVPEPNTSIIRILFTARMIREKGVFELIEAANSLRNKYCNKIRFILCGGIDDNPQAISEKELTELCDGDYIQWLGYRTDIKELLIDSHIVALPSYYKEGIPKSLIEACAIGRPIVTTDSTGCRDTVVDGYNGFLVPIKNSIAMAEKLAILIENKTLRLQMGNNSRKLAEKEFSIKNVVEKHLEIYNKLLANQIIK